MQQSTGMQVGADERVHPLTWGSIPYERFVDFWGWLGRVRLEGRVIYA
jgi:hypothetical protein